MNPMQQATPVQQGGSNVLAGYAAGDQEMPLAGYAALVGVFSASFGAALAASKHSGRLKPEDVTPGDILLLGVATHKLTRMITRDWVTSPLRAPFTKYEGSTGSGEVKEVARGRGVRKAIGDLLTCPWCTGPWVASGLAFGTLLAPRPTRLVTQILAAVTISDFLHIGYDTAKKVPKS